MKHRGSRKRSQRGMEAVEFGMFFVLTFPPLAWMFINGMNFVRLDKANDTTRAAALMYVKGQDFTLAGTQNIIAMVAQGLDLEAVTANGATGSGTGSGLIIFSTVQYIGTNTCSSCMNLNNYMFLSRVYVGNQNLRINGSQAQSSLGAPSSAVWSTTSGAVSNSQTNTGARVAASFANFGTDTNGHPIVIGDGQIVYVIESYFVPQGGFGTGQFNGNGIYTRVLM